MPIIAVVNIRQFSPRTRLKAAPESQVFCCKGHRTDDTHNQYHEVRGVANFLFTNIKSISRDVANLSTKELVISGIGVN